MKNNENMKMSNKLKLISELDFDEATIFDKNDLREIAYNRGYNTANRLWMKRIKEILEW